MEEIKICDVTKDIEHLAEALKTARENSCKTVEYMAQRVGCNRGMIYKYEGNLVKIPAYVVIVYARTLELPPSTFFDYNNDPADEDLVQQIQHKLPNLPKSQLNLIEAIISTYEMERKRYKD